MNRRAFLATLGAVATQQKLGEPSFQNSPIDTISGLSTIAVSRFPYVQNVRQDRASILWATFDSGFGQLKYSSDGVNFNVVTASRRPFNRTETQLAYDYVQYQADITGLSPNTDYLYSAVVDGQEVSSAGEKRFRTAGPGPFKFVVLGDSGWDKPLTDAQGLIAQYIAADRPSMVIHTGDLVYPLGSYDYYQRNYFNYYSATMSSVPFFPCPGNHDYDIPNAVPYLAIHSVPTEGVPAVDRGRYYSYDWGNVHFVSIDAHQALDRAVNNNGPMLRWLDNDLRSTRQFWRIVYFHYPPYATGSNTGDVQSQWVRQYMVPIFETHGVQLVFSGHEHSYQRTVPVRKSTTVAPGVGTNYIVSGGGGAQLYGVVNTPLFAFSRSAYHYVRAEVQGTQITIHSIRQDGVELENYTIAPTPVFSDDPKIVPVTMAPGPVAGAVIRIIGRGLAAEENFACTPTPPSDLSGTVVTINGRPLQLLYVSPTQILARLPFNVDGNATVRITTANGFIERSI
jgi:hypothetical protein